MKLNIKRFNQEKYPQNEISNFKVTNKNLLNDVKNIVKEEERKADFAGSLVFQTSLD